MSFNEIKDRFNVPQTHFFKKNIYNYKVFFFSKLNHSSNCHPLTVIEQFVTQPQQSKGQISTLYNIFLIYS